MVYKTKIINHQPSIVKSTSGFTLVELLAVLSIFVVVGMFITSILISTLRNTNKTNAVAAVQTNGSYAIDQMSKLIRSARALDASVSCGTIANPVSASSLAVIGADDNKITFSCTKDSNNNPIIASNGATLTDPNQVEWIDCSFTCGRNTPSDYPIIGIFFTLQFRSNGSSTFADQTASSSAIPFQTSVIMRNQIR
jgi:prepilin-type N-terminal cleavage/methylation domain-containing protein